MFVTHRRFALLAVLLVLLTGVFAPAVASAQDDVLAPEDFRAAVRQLWEDHIVWTRAYIVSAAADLPDQEFVAERLLANQDDIGNAIKPFYGEEAGNQLSALLREHITGAVDLLGAAKAGDNDAVQVASDAWNANADEIAAFLNSANPDNWAADHMAEEMRMHLELTLQEAQARLGGDYAADIAAYDEIHEHILHMADHLSDGIIAQFPERFGS